MSKRKYTQFVAPAPNPKAQLLGKLYATKEGLTNPYATFQEAGDEEGAAAYFRALGQEKLRPILQDATEHFPEGFRMDYVGDIDGNGPSVPNLNDVKWTKAGDPANAYFPDLTSPGTPGRVDPLSRNTDPELTTADIDPNWQVSDNTRSPSNGSANKIYTSNDLTNKSIQLGDSGAGKE